MLRKIVKNEKKGKLDTDLHVMILIDVFRHMCQIVGSPALQSIPSSFAAFVELIRQIQRLLFSLFAFSIYSAAIS